MQQAILFLSILNILTILFLNASNQLYDVVMHSGAITVIKAAGCSYAKSFYSVLFKKQTTYMVPVKGK